jgi:transcriptional regulator with XRE-family HTH domain
MLNSRRRQLGITRRALARMSGVPIATVNRILADPGKVRFEHVAAVGQVLGINFAAAKKLPVRRMLQERALVKARYVARAVQATQGLEAAGVDAPGFERLVGVAATTLLAGKKRKLWDED